MGRVDHLPYIIVILVTFGLDLGVIVGQLRGNSLVIFRAEPTPWAHNLIFYFRRNTLFPSLENRHGRE